MVKWLPIAILLAGCGATGSGAFYQDASLCFKSVTTESPIDISVLRHDIQLLTRLQQKAGLFATQQEACRALFGYDLVIRKDRRSWYGADNHIHERGVTYPDGKTMELPLSLAELAHETLHVYDVGHGVSYGDSGRHKGWDANAAYQGVMVAYMYGYVSLNWEENVPFDETRGLENYPAY